MVISAVVLIHKDLRSPTGILLVLLSDVIGTSVIVSLPKMSITLTATV